MSMMEVIILSSAGIVALTALSSYILNQQKSARDITQTIEARSKEDQIIDLLADPVACGINYNGLPANIQSSHTSIRDSAGIPRMSVGDTYPGGLLELQRITKRAASPPAAPSSSGEFELQLDFRKKGGFLGSDFVPVKVPLIIQTDAAGNISGCSSRKQIMNVTCRVATGGSRANCPANYKLTGGGLRTSSLGKGRYYSYPIAPPGGTNGTGAWVCRASGSTSCYAICCL